MPAKAGAIRAGKAFVELFADDSKFVRGLKRAEGQLKAFGARVRNIGLKLVAISALFAMPLIAGTKVFATFQEQMANVSTMVDDCDKHMAGFTTGVRDMAAKFGETTEALAGGLYDILSASVDATSAMDVLAVSVKAAKGGMTDTKIAADAITTVLNAYGLSASRAEDVSDLLFSIVKRGKTTFAELAPSIGLVATTASSAGVGLEELGAALAVMTRSGVQTRNAITALNAIVASFLSPTAEAAATAKKLGFDLSSAMIKSEGLSGIFKRISHLPPDAIAKLFPSIRALRGVLPALKNMGGFLKDVEAMSDRAGAAENAYQKMSKTLMNQFRKIKEAGKTVLSVIGEALAPAIEKVVPHIEKWAKYVRDLVENNKELIVSIAKVVLMVAAIGAGLIAAGTAVTMFGFFLSGVITIISTAAAVIGVLGAALGVLFSPAGLLIVGIALVTAGIVGLAANILQSTGLSGRALASLTEKFNTLKEDALKAWKGIGDALVAGDLKLAAKILWVTLKIEWQRGVNLLRKVWLDFKNWFIEKFGATWEGALALAEIAWHQLEKGWIDITKGFTQAWAAFTSFFAASWEQMKAWAKKGWVFIKDILGASAAETEKAYAEIEEARKAALTEIATTLIKDWTQADDKWHRDRERSEAIHQATMAAIGRDTTAEREAAYNKAIADGETELAKLLKERDEAIAEAERKRKEKEKEKEKVAGKAVPGVADVAGAVAGLQNQMLAVMGTFLHPEMLGYQAEAVDNRIASAVEETAKNTKGLLNKFDDGAGLVFES